MGRGTYDSGAYAAFASSTATRSRDEIFTSRKIDDSLNPLGVKIRESRDSSYNPQSTPLIVGVDVTGSMGMLAEVIARKGLGTLFENIINRKPITDPHVMFMAIGDPACDKAPLQVSQFEADLRIIEQLTSIYLEGGGGGNNTEGYQMPWYFASEHTVHDSIEKRGKRGYLFTIGDEQSPAVLTKKQIKTFIGDDVQQDFTPTQLLEMAQRKYECFHIMIAEGHHMKYHRDAVVKSWNGLLDKRAIVLEDHTKLAETIVSAIEISEGVSVDSSVSGWGMHAQVIYDAVKSLPRGAAPGGPKLIGKAS